MMILQDGFLVAESEAVVSPLCDGFLYGYGVFETIRVAGGRPRFWTEHEERLLGAAAEVGLQPLPGGMERAARVLAANHLSAGVLKWVLYQAQTGTGELMIPRPYPYSDDDFRRGFALRTMAGAGRAAKTLNYLANVRARRAALASGCEEALFISPDRRVLEGAVTSIFAVEDGRVITPPLSEGILAGIARARVIGLAGAAETPLPRERLLAADEVFVTNALLGVMPVRAIDARAWEPAAYRVVPALRAEWQQLPG